MVSEFQAAENGARKEIWNTWIFQFKNRNLRVVPASRTSTPSEHSTRIRASVSDRSVEQLRSEWESADSPRTLPLLEK